MTNSAEHDCFLSHNSKDKPTVRELARRLGDRGIRVWLDEDQLIPGRNWQPLLEQGIDRSATGAVLVGRDGLGPWEDEEMQALLRHAVTAGKPVIPVLLPGAPGKPELPLFLANRMWVDLRQGLTDEGIGKLVWGITGVKLEPPDKTDASSHPAHGPGRYEPAPAIDARTWDAQRSVLRDLLVALPDWDTVPDRKAFVKAALGSHPAARLVWEGEVHTVAGDLVEKLRFFDAKPLPDGRHAVCGVLSEIHRREWDLNPEIGETVQRLAAAFGCERP